MIDVGILTPHAAAGADDEFCVMAGKDVRTHVRRISLLLDGSAPTSPEVLRARGPVGGPRDRGRARPEEPAGDRLRLDEHGLPSWAPTGASSSPARLLGQLN
jgi:hypothetical protein